MTELSEPFAHPSLMRPKFALLYTPCAYVPVSFVLGMIALMFPVHPTEDQIATYHLFWTLAHRILPIRGEGMEKTLAQCATQRTTRADLFDFVVTSLERIVGKKSMSKKELLVFFTALRANECRAHGDDAEAKEESIPKVEKGCVRTVGDNCPATCCVLNFTRVLPAKTFQIAADINFLPGDDVASQWTTDQAFCSCYFSAKWFFLHLVASAFPLHPTKQDQYLYHTFLMLFGKLLACFACRVNFESNMELAHYHPKDALQSNASFVHFLHTLHDCVNAMLDKAIRPTSAQDTAQTLAQLSASAENEYYGQILILKESQAFGRFFVEP